MNLHGTRGAADAAQEACLRNPMIGAIVRRALEHPEFRDQLIADPARALDAHGFALEGDDFRQIEGICSDLGKCDPGDVEQKLLSIAESQGIDPRPAQRG